MFLIGGNVWSQNVVTVQGLEQTGRDPSDDCDCGFRELDLKKLGALTLH